MKSFGIIIIFFFCCSTGFSQKTQEQETHLAGYKRVLQKIVNKDTLLTKTSQKYKCSEDFFGTIEYYKDKELQLIAHVYKPGFYEEYVTEYYYLQNDSLLLQTVISRKIHLNTQSFESKHKQMVSAEKVAEVTEQRVFLNADSTNPECYERSHGMKVSEWDQRYFDSLKFEKSTCTETLEDIRYKYRLLRKAEQKLNRFRKNPGCIFHLW